MDPKAETPHTGSDAHPRKRLSRRASVIGGVLAVAVLAGTGWLAWRLTHPAADPASSAAGPGRPGGAGGRGAPATTVGVAKAELADRKSTRLNSSHIQKSRMPSSA